MSNLIDQSWHVEFDSYGGYDCTTSGYHIRTGNNIRLFTIECETRLEDPEKERLANHIVALHNNYITILGG